MLLKAHTLPQVLSEGVMSSRDYHHVVFILAATHAAVNAKKERACQSLT